ncbi:NACHT and WD repeat domain-containing protein 2-like isoform X1 [Hemiscyllium ocellatum]|uniref:NACHT and WD repeat domain-containing protein 2-like isoform X1 n=1 Tax=Hemiscyllium ocellatum TaxID=170820 RepID=UPI0029666E50|nr:NACHT and WD repeat domain-containing protein 2-like isoform X1 [Hemiscyllium ocellatum]
MENPTPMFNVPGHDPVTYFSRVPTTQASRCVQIFICCNPEDTEAERKALREGVYPKLREYCRHKHGLEFQAVDMYIGVDPDDVHDASVRKLRMKLLDECLKFSAGPCFAALIGEQYGSASVPAEIEAREFEMILCKSQNKGLRTRLLQNWYQRDENSVPPAYYLRSKTDVLPNYCNKIEGRAKEVARVAWRENFAEMKMIFNETVKMCLKEGTIKPDQAQKYFTSALEEELLHALENQSQSVLQKCICYICKVPHLTRHLKTMLKDQKGQTDCDSQLPHDAQDYAKLLRLRDEILPALVNSSNLHVYTSTLLDNHNLNSMEQMKQEYIEGLCQQFYMDVVKLIDSSNVQRVKDRFDSGTEEIVRHASMCHLYVTLSDFEWKEVDQIKEYILRKQSKSPFIIVGGPCSGKTLLMATCAKQVHSWLKNCTPVVVSLFVSSTNYNNSLRNILAGICQQIAIGYHKSTQIYTDNIDILVNCFINLLEESSEQHPLTIMIDAVDQISETHSTRAIWWLPKSLPPFTKLVISTTLKKYEIAQKSMQLNPDAAHFLELKPRERQECNKILTQRLRSSSRRITSGQQVYINAALQQCTLPLFVNLLYSEMLFWRSNEDIDEQTLGRSVHDSINRLLKRLERRHGESLVSRALGYITLATSGLGEIELLDILSLDDYVIEHYWLQNGSPDSMKVAYYSLAKLEQDLSGFLVGRLHNGIKLLFWTNRHFPLVVNKRYLRNMETVQQMHNLIVEYFSGRWSSGRGKPLFVTMLPQKPKEDQPMLCQISESDPLMKRYVDRQQPSQPWFFHFQSSNPCSVYPNHRKVEELAYHLKRSGRLGELYLDVMSSFVTHQAMIETGHLVHLIAELEENIWTINRREMRFLAAVLKSAHCLLRDSSDQLSMAIQMSLLPLVHCFPQLLNYLKQSYQDGLRNNVLAVLHSPVITVPGISAALCTSDLAVATDIIEIHSQSLVLVTLESGAIHAWNLEVQAPWEQISTKGVKVSGAQISDGDQFLVLATVHSTILVYDLAQLSLLNEIDMRRSHDDSTAGIRGFALCSTTAVVWFENSTEVSVCDINSCQTSKQLNCPHQIQCVSFTLDRTYALCGQIKSTVTIFNIHTGLQITEIVFEFTEASVYSILQPEFKEEICVVDKIGNICVWSMEDMTEPHLLEEIVCTEDENEVLCVELSSCSLLLCRASCIELWNTLGWNISNKFKPPKGTSFVQAILSQDCESIIAVINGSQALFVWKKETGQCVLILENRLGPPLRLSKCYKQKALVVFTSKGFLKSWDLDCIDTASAIATTERSIHILLPSQGKHFYTSDGTSIIFKWNLTFSQIEAAFIHADDVKHCALTRTGASLVTADVSGDLYVWDTEAGQNLHRIKYGDVTQLLITPNDRFVVSICENLVSKVWKLAKGHVICTIHTYLKNAVITPESTFVLGLHQRFLLAVSLWSGAVVKRFECTDKADIVAFQTLSNFPDYVMLVTSCGNIYTWNIIEESLYRQVQLPVKFLSQLDVFQVSNDGKIAMISVITESISVLDILHGKLSVINTEGVIFSQQLTHDGKHIVYVCYGHPCHCDHHSNAKLNIVRTKDGKHIGSCYLCKIPSCLAVSKYNLNIFVGFEDGTIGIYTIVDSPGAQNKFKGQLSNVGKTEYPPKKKHWSCKNLPDAFWVDFLHEGSP